MAAFRMPSVSMAVTTTADHRTPNRVTVATANCTVSSNIILKIDRKSSNGLVVYHASFTVVEFMVMSLFLNAVQESIVRYCRRKYNLVLDLIKINLVAARVLRMVLALPHLPANRGNESYPNFCINDGFRAILDFAHQNIEVYQRVETFLIGETENFGKPVLCGDVSSQKKSYGKSEMRIYVLYMNLALGAKSTYSPE
ncbi:hypothetical protein AGLY_010279 [Aphis glycines]|uniref:Uncharacterized protein n=1 Tax=Aphis glycines TaxID=307491 RepID=A0A6G0TGU9_APHGL|nr:hypothetical protein AGLY_010279 [Aphis glycines]